MGKAETVASTRQSGAKSRGDLFLECGGHLDEIGQAHFRAA